MGLIDRFRRRTLEPDDDFSPMPGFRVVAGESTQFIADRQTLTLMREGRAQRTAQEQYLVLDMLVEEGRAEAADDGFVVSAAEVARLEDDDVALLGLPPRFPGTTRATVRRWTESPEFRIDFEMKVGAHPAPWERRGPIVVVGDGRYLVSAPLLQVLRALEQHSALSPAERTELENVGLVARLQAAQQVASSSADPALRDPSLKFSLGALDEFTTVTPSSVGLMVESRPDGSLVVEPDLGAGIDRTLLSARWQQLDASAPQTEGERDLQGVPEEGAILRVDDTLVILPSEQLTAVQEVRRRPRIPVTDVRQFLRAPGGFFNPDIVDVDISFSVRVAGLGIIAPMTFAEAASSGLDWFAAVGSVSQPEVLAEVARTAAEQLTIEEKVEEAWAGHEDVVAVHEQLIDISQRSRVEQALAASRERLEALAVSPMPSGEVPQADEVQEGEHEVPGVQVTVGMHIHEAHDIADSLRFRAAQAAPVRPVAYERLKRSPFPHQTTGIEWMAGLMQSAVLSQEHDPGRIQGALLADDMGLGKTFMALVALAEAQDGQRDAGHEPLPVLGVMPVALLGNWLEEIEATFGTQNGPFTDVVVLQGTGVAQFRHQGARRETEASVHDLDEDGMVLPDRIVASLRVGPEWGEARLDRPGVLVLTTYETLRRYQVSLGAVKWGVVVFDEAQATKNPETLAARAAKALDARFKLLATGTPVENSLRDFWSLIDTAQPGLLGTWGEFRETWVIPMDEATGEEYQRLGRDLRDAVGEFMLRRVKEDHLVDLPRKNVHEYPQAMPAAQADAYGGVLARHRGRSGTQGAALKTLHELAFVSLHPGLLAGRLDSGADGIAGSARTFVVVRRILEEIRARGEKAIVFAKTKEMQRALSLWLGNEYGFRVDVVNGDTTATGSGENRMTKIRAFEARSGFNVIILSPLAVGVGLTIVGANHAIHLERHWNPAKEAQATDRIYRIGQEREVHVHYPIAIHPTVESFDVNLDRLLRTKVALKDAVVVPQEVTQAELERGMGLL